MQNQTSWAAAYHYSSDYDSQICDKAAVLRVGAVLMPLFYGLVAALSVLGNGLALLVLLRPRGLKSLTDVFILNLALSDLLFTCGLPVYASYHAQGWTLGVAGCRAVRFLFHAGFYSSVLFLTLMTAQRYMAVVHPLSRWEGCAGFRVAPGLAWALSVAPALAAALRSGVVREGERRYCDYSDARTKAGVAYLQNALFLMAFLVMGFCYGAMLRTLARSHARRKRRAIRLIFCVALAFLLSWAPFNVSVFLRTRPLGDCALSTRLDYAHLAFKLLAYAHCCLNPLLYVFVGGRFRAHLRLVLRRVCPAKKNTDSSPNRATRHHSLGSLG